MRVFDSFTGKSVEQKVAEYSEVYGEVLLGLHRDLEGLRRDLVTSFRSSDEIKERVLALAKEIEPSTRAIGEVSKRLQAQARQIRQLRALCGLSYLLVLGLAVGLWLSL